eukprot:6138822-Pyramimonas_sp.AAC.1
MVGNTRNTGSEGAPLARTASESMTCSGVSQHNGSHTSEEMRHPTPWLYPRRLAIPGFPSDSIMQVRFALVCNVNNGINVHIRKLPLMQPRTVGNNHELDIFNFEHAQRPGDIGRRDLETTPPLPEQYI